MPLLNKNRCPVISDLAIHNLLTQGFPTFLLPCSPSAFQKISMYPFSDLTDEHLPLKFLMTKYFIMLVHRYI